MWCGIISIFPEMFLALSESGITSRAIKKGLCELAFFNPRDYSKNPQGFVDDRPYGGGPGMVMCAEPLLAAINAAKAKAIEAGKPEPKVVYLSPQGKTFDQALADKMSKHESLILLAGRYEGIDERVIELAVDEAVSIGDYVLSGGELPAMVMLDAMIRLMPGALGHEESASQDSFQEGLLDCPHYTRPETVAGLKVPDVLLSGHHQEIEQFRAGARVSRTRTLRPDLLEDFESRSVKT